MVIAPEFAFPMVTVPVDERSPNSADVRLKVPLASFNPIVVFAVLG